MTISVALTTYNGMRYLLTQLDSIKNQSRIPDEVIIDDCSNDGTYEYMEDYIKKNNLHNWKLFRNKTNIGWKKNFRLAFLKCKSDLIFPCDQDYIWSVNKIEKMEVVMSQNNSILLLTSNYKVDNIDREEKVLVRGLNKNDESVRLIKFCEKNLTLMRPGCTYCVRRFLLYIMFLDDMESEPHDQMLWIHAIIHDGLYHLNSITMKYRRHSDSASTPERRLSKDRRYKEAETNVAVYNFFKQVCLKYHMNHKADIINKHIKFINKRVDALKRNSVMWLIFFQIMNHRHYATVRNMLSDEYLIISSKKM